MSFRKIIPPQAKSCPQPPQRLARYILSNPKIFSTRLGLLPKIDNFIKSQENPRCATRHFVLEGIELSESPVIRRDHTGTREEWIYHCTIANRRDDIAAINTIAVLKSIVSVDGSIITVPHNSFLRWIGIVADYSKTISPGVRSSFDLLCISKENPDYVYLHSANFGSSQYPIIKTRGTYILEYNIFAEGFNLLEFRIKLFLTGNIDTTTLEIEKL